MVGSGVLGRTGNQNCFHHVHDIKVSVKSREINVRGERKVESGKWKFSIGKTLGGGMGITDGV